jgi:hypothetical protein
VPLLLLAALLAANPGDAGAPALDADLNVVLSDHHFLLSAPVTAGRYLLLCAALEETGRHYDLGMIDRFVIE